jgi:dTDP-4-amino-4,6-dideoxygalactose transaminase
MPKLAALGGTPVRTKPFSEWPIFPKSAIKAAYDTLKNRKLKYFPEGIVTRFEEALAKVCEAKFVICVFNGTVSLELALRSIGIVYNSEVIIPGYDHPANLNSVTNIGAKPRFADVDYERPNMSPKCAENLINKKTKAIVVTHMVGLANMEAFERISKQYNIAVIYDCARVIGSEWSGKGVGQFGTASSFSFEESKFINAGEGGAIATNDPELAERIYAYRDRGRDKNGKLIRKGIIGSNYRMTEFQAACLIPQLSYLDNLIRQRIKAMNYLRELLENIQGVWIPTFDEHCTKIAHYNVTLRYDHTSFNDLKVNQVVRFLNAEGIPCKSEWQLPYRYAQQVGILLHPKPVCPTAEKVYSETITLHGRILHSRKKDLEDIAKALKKIQDWSNLCS